MTTMRRCGKPWMHGKLKGCGYKVTVGRQSILDILRKTNKHLSAEEIYLKVHEIYPSIGLTSVYRTLELLESMGMVSKFAFGDGRARYELLENEEGKNHHHHLVCTNCNRVIDYTDFLDQEIKLLKETEKELSKKYNFNITNHLIQFYGTCDKCGAIK